MIGLGLKIQVNQAIGEVSTLLSALQSRAAYFHSGRDKSPDIAAGQDTFQGRRTVERRWF